MEYYLIRFVYTDYYPRDSREVETLLVIASSYKEACTKIGVRYKEAREFENLTI
jgi:hypothetical protein